MTQYQHLSGAAQLQIREAEIYATYFDTLLTDHSIDPTTLARALALGLEGRKKRDRLYAVGERTCQVRSLVQRVINNNGGATRSGRLRDSAAVYRVVAPEQDITEDIEGVSYNFALGFAISPWKYDGKLGFVHSRSNKDVEEGDYTPWLFQQKGDLKGNFKRLITSSRLVKLLEKKGLSIAQNADFAEPQKMMSTRNTITSHELRHIMDNLIGSYSRYSYVETPAYLAVGNFNGIEKDLGRQIKLWQRRQKRGSSKSVISEPEVTSTVTEVDWVQNRERFHEKLRTFEGSKRMLSFLLSLNDPKNVEIILDEINPLQW
jgi:hypothetical protein